MPPSGGTVDEPTVAGAIVNIGSLSALRLFIDHSQIVQLECLRAGIWGTDETWGRIHRYRPSGERA